MPNQSHLYALYGFNETTTILADGTTKVNRNGDNWGNVQSKCVIMDRRSGKDTLRANQSGLTFQNDAHQPELSDIKLGEDTWYTYTLEVVPQQDGTANITVTVINAENPEDIEHGGQATYTIWKYHQNTDWYQWPAAGLGFAKIGGTGTVSIDNVKVYEAPTVDEDGVAVESKAVSKENITDIRVEYTDGTSQSLTANTVGQTVKSEIDRIAVEFSSPLSILPSEQVLQPADVVKTSKLVAEKNPTLITKDDEKVTSTLTEVVGTSQTMNPADTVILDNEYLDCLARYKVYDVLEDVIQFKRLGNQAEANDVVFNRYLSADKKTCYFEFDQQLTENVDYVLTVDKNIPFTSSIYAGLDESAIVKFGVVNEEGGVHITDVSFERDAGSVYAPVKSVADLMTQLEAGKKAYMIVDGYNTTDEKAEMYAIAAQYEKDETTGASVLVNCTCVPIEIDAKTSLAETLKVQLDIDLTKKDSTDEVKCFVWNKVNHAPMAEMLVID